MFLFDQINESESESESESDVLVVYISGVVIPLHLNIDVMGIRPV